MHTWHKKLVFYELKPWLITGGVEKRLAIDSGEMACVGK
jgi:hypothetical protein